jgi:cytochrome P450
MPFGMGHRACIGRNVAMVNIVKVLTVLMRCYRIEAVHDGEGKGEGLLRTTTVGIGQMEEKLRCRVSVKEG